VRRAARSGGFTFLELMIVIAIISLLASIVVVNLDGISAPTRLRGVARRLGSQVQELRTMSTLKNRPMSIEFDLDKQRWRIIDAPSETDVPDPDEREEATFYGDWESPPPGVRFEVAFSATDVDTTGTAMITFQGDGEIVPSGFVAYLEHERLPEDSGMSVEVSGLTGIVAYHDGHMKAEEIRRPEDM
jgi:prepilin-type N-terminal cleavage/methylation domain-containing protein